MLGCGMMIENESSNMDTDCCQQLARHNKLQITFTIYHFLQLHQDNMYESEMLITIAHLSVLAVFTNLFLILLARAIIYARCTQCHVNKYETPSW